MQNQLLTGLRGQSRSMTLTQLSMNGAKKHLKNWILIVKLVCGVCLLILLINNNLLNLIKASSFLPPVREYEFNIQKPWLQ